MKKNWPQLLAMLAPLVVFAAWGLLDQKSRSPVPASRGETLSIIKSATQIETYYVKRGGLFAGKRIKDCSVVGQGLTPDRKTTRQLKVLLLSHLRAPANHMGQKGGPPPISDAAIRFIHGNESVDILLSFGSCDLMVVDDATPTSEWRDFYFPEAEGRTLIKIARKLFPEDTELKRAPAYY